MTHSINFNNRLFLIISHLLVDYISSNYRYRGIKNLEYNEIAHIVENAYDILTSESSYNPPNPFDDPNFIRFLVFYQRIKKPFEDRPNLPNDRSTMIRKISDLILANVPFYDFWDLPLNSINNCSELSFVLNKYLSLEINDLFDFNCQD